MRSYSQVTSIAAVGAAFIILLTIFSTAGTSNESNVVKDIPLMISEDTVAIQNECDLVAEKVEGRHFTLDGSKNNINTIILPFKKYRIYFAHGQFDHREYGQTVLIKIPEDLAMVSATAVNLDDTSQVVSIALVAKNIEPQILRIKYQER